MPLARHDFRCALCGFLLRDVEGTAPLTDPSRNPRCPAHQFPLGGYLMDWIPFSRFSCFTDSGREGAGSFAKATVQVDDPGALGGFREEVVGSLADIRRLEKESETRARNHEGAPLVWRDYSQDRSNRHTHTLMADPSLTPPRRLTSGEPVGVRRGDPVIADHGEAG